MTDLTKAFMIVNILNVESHFISQINVIKVCFIISCGLRTADGSLVSYTLRRGHSSN